MRSTPAGPSLFPHGSIPQFSTLTSPTHMEAPIPGAPHCSPPTHPHESTYPLMLHTASLPPTRMKAPTP